MAARKVWIVTLRLASGTKTKEQTVLAPTEALAMFRAEEIGANRFYTAIEAKEVQQ